MEHITRIKLKHLIIWEKKTNTPDYMRKEKKKKRKMRERREGRNEGGRREVQTRRTKRKRYGWNWWPAVGGNIVNGCRPTTMSGCRPTAGLAWFWPTWVWPATETHSFGDFIFWFFLMGFASMGLILFYFFWWVLLWILFFGFFFDFLQGSDNF